MNLEEKKAVINTTTKQAIDNNKFEASAVAKVIYLSCMQVHHFRLSFFFKLIHVSILAIY